MATNEIGILILAAGSSSRMGVSKQMLPVNGTSLLAKTVSTAVETKIENIVVVLGSNADEHRIVANEFPITTILNPDWQKGIGSSIKLGITHFSKQSSIKQIIILVCDQPTLTSKILLNLVHKQEETNKPIIASKYANTLGVPALFTSNMFEKFSSLKDDQGAKKIILQNEHDVATIDFSSGEIDLDTPEDYDTFLKNTKP